MLYPLQYLNNLRLRQAVVILLIGLFAFNTFSRAGKWANPQDLFLAEVEHHPNSALANGEMGAMLSNISTPDPISMDISYIAARGYFETAANLDRNDTKPLFGLIMLSARRGKTIDPGWVHELTHRLEVAPYAAISSDKLNALTECQLGGNCRLAEKDLGILLHAALRNPTMTGVNRAKVLYALSSYTINVVKDYPGALEIMQQMVQAAPQEVGYRFALIEFLIASRRFNEAKEQLAILKRLDTKQLHSAEIASQEQTIFKQDKQVSVH
jgi:hypothetical protein